MLNGIEPRDDNKKGKPEIAVTPGPTVNITTPGTTISKRQLRENVPVFEEHTVDDDLLAEGRTNLRDYFQAQGYSDVEVKYREQQASNGATEISYAIELGKRHTLIQVEISGNKYFDQKTIRERMFLIPKSFEFRRGRYSEAFLKRDIPTIKDLYESNGFRDAGDHVPAGRRLQGPDRRSCGVSGHRRRPSVSCRFARDQGGEETRPYEDR